MHLRKEPDVRTLCGRCRMNYERAGYQLSIVWTKTKEPCDICGRPGHDYIVSKSVFGSFSRL